MKPTAHSLDAADPLASFRDRFVVTDPELVYLDGNSLGRLPVATVGRARDLIEAEWGDRLIRSWNEGWWEAPVRIGDAIAPLVGAQPGEVAIADATSVNLYKLVVAALRARPGRSRILTDDMNFPSDLYILEGATQTLGEGHTVEDIPSPDGIHGPAEQIIEAIDEHVALVTLSHVTFKSGYRYDIGAISDAAREAGALVLWDLSHSVGAVPIDLSRADLAIGCTYKYLNGGPGAPAFLYVRSDLQPALENPLSGWWGHGAPFAFDAAYEPADGIRKFLTGTAPMASLAMIEPGVALVREAGIDRLAAKSAAQSTYLIERWDRELAPLGYTLNSPTDQHLRGSHVSLGHPNGLGIDLALIHRYGVLPDFRPPDNLRIGITPLSTRFAELDTAIAAMVDIVETGAYLDYEGSQPTVT